MSVPAPEGTCSQCGHKLGDHYAFGCQHLEPVYEDGWLRRHDRCRCKYTPDGKPVEPTPGYSIWED